MTVAVSGVVPNVPDLGVGELLFEWNGSDLTQFDSAQTHQRNGGGGPAGTAVWSVAPNPLYPSVNVLQCVGTGFEGGSCLPVALSELTLPDQFTVEAVMSKDSLVTNLYAGVLLYVVDGASAVQAISVGASNGASMGLYTGAVIDNAGGAGGDIIANAGIFGTGAVGRKGYLGSVFSRPRGETPTVFEVDSDLRTDTGYRVTASGSYATKPAALTTEWDALTFTRVGPMALIQTTPTAFEIYFHSFRVWTGRGPVP